MSLITLDCVGLPCPKPVLKTKEALDNGAQLLLVVVDNEASKNNVTRFAGNQGCRISDRLLDNGHFEISITGTGEEQQNLPLDSADYSCKIPISDGLIYVISADRMGRGSEELGWALLQTFIQTIKEVKPLPAKILFYNSGVKLVVEQSGALEALTELQKQGVEILVCGTCLDFFKLKSSIKVGQISNMYDIMNTMTKAAKVISPQ
ncbi:MAG: sulfurtransferase-like selenium metabolism protein YedF [Desulfobacterales bacterium]|nr:MAG: sulfurtransferase-like selenium metabolism protein YedF [Desulfobacterales bacterium]